MLVKAKQLLGILAYKYRGDYTKMLNAIRSREAFADSYMEEALNKLDSKYITIVDDDIYPESYKKCCYNPPIVLFYKGDINLLKEDPRKFIGIIGSRDSSEYGKEATRKIIKGLPKDKIIVSGMAKGIDSVAHQAALDNGLKTIAVLGSGIDYCYPQSNKELYENIIKNGGLIISEYPEKDEPKRENFIFRNRLIATLASFLLVAEAYDRSGTSTTVNYALQKGISIGAIPYSLNKKSFCNQIIKEGAYLIESAEDILDVMEN